MKKKLYAVVDLETTGGKASREKIIEVAIVLYDGEKIIDQWESLIHPERAISYSITRLTGITNDMVVDAPKFYEVAKKIVEMTEGAIFVAHNVRFDYQFLREEFLRLGFSFSRKQLCTVRLSRQAFPGLKGYGLSKLIDHFNIPIAARHRAMGDTMATVDLLGRILRQEGNDQMANDMINQGVKESKLPKDITLDILHALPETCGVYYFLDEDKDIAYIGKSTNIRKRVMQHFAKASEKALKLHRKVREITYEEMGSELIALLYESQLIKEEKPYINRAQRTYKFPYMVHSYLDIWGYLRFEIVKNIALNRKKYQMVSEYTSAMSARGFLGRVREEYELCSFLCGIDKTVPCFDAQIQQCRGACTQKESSDDYNERAQMGIKKLSTVFDKDFFILEPGRSENEFAVVQIEDGICKGFGFLDQDSSQGAHLEALQDAIKPYPAYPETTRIIRTYLKNHPQAKIITYDKAVFE